MQEAVAAGSYPAAGNTTVCPSVPMVSVPATQPKQWYNGTWQQILCSCKNETH